MTDQWHELEMMNVTDEAQIPRVMSSRAYIEVSDAIKLQWWMQLCKSYTKGVWE